MFATESVTAFALRVPPNCQPLHTALPPVVPPDAALNVLVQSVRVEAVSVVQPRGAADWLNGMRVPFGAISSPGRNELGGMKIPVPWIMISAPR